MDNACLPHRRADLGTHHFWLLSQELAGRIAVQMRCPHCHQTLPDESIVGKLGLRGGPWRIYDIVRRAGANGIDSSELFNLLYDSRSDGGPETGMRSLYVRIWMLNKRLRPLGKEISAAPCSWGPGSYVLRDYKPTSA